MNILKRIARIFQAPPAPPTKWIILKSYKRFFVAQKYVFKKGRWVPATREGRPIKKFVVKNTPKNYITNEDAG